MARRSLVGINLRIGAVVLGTIVIYTLIANAIPQIESEVPQELTFTGEITAAQLVEAGKSLYEGAGGCTACHGLGTRAPNLLTAEVGLGPIGTRCGQRVPGEDCKTYLHRSLVEPSAYVVEGYQPIMPDVSRTMSSEQIWALVAYLESLGGEVTVTAADIQSTAAEAPTGPGPTAPGAALSGTVDARTLLDEFACLACHKLGDEGQVVGPEFNGIGGRRDAAYIRQSILDPGADVAPGYEPLAAVMPRDFGQRMTAAQLEAVVEFLARQR